MNREWKYIRQNVPNAHLLNLNDSQWESVGIPHSFSIPYFLSKEFYEGYGWYRKKFKLEKTDSKKHYFIEFDGVFQDAEIYVNEQIAGRHIGGYTGFSIDVTQFVHPGENLLAVRVNNLWRPDIAPRAGEHTFSGGIYRNIRLVQKAPLYIDWYGTFITTPDLKSHTGKQSRVRIATEIWNRTGKNDNYTLKTEILDEKNEVITSTQSTEYIADGTLKQIIQTTSPIQHPALWHPDHPHLYTAVSSVYSNGKLMDRTETTFGFRWFEWTSDKGFFFNGKHHVLRGVNVHQDQAGWGDAVTEAASRRDIQQMKDAGFDFIRGSHYPHSPAFSEACDEIGMLFWSEAPFWGIGGFKPDGYWNSSAYPVAKEDQESFEASALGQLAEMIRIHRNHPSIIVWSMCNEAFFSDPKVMDGVRNLLTKMVSLSHQLDSTRPAAIGGAQRPLGAGRIDKLGDLAGYNGDGATQPDFKDPGIPSIVSEYGSTTSNRPGEYTPGWGCLLKDDTWKGYPWRGGQAIWCGFDHGSIAGSSLGKMGIVDYFRIPKRSWYWYRNTYQHIEPPRWPQQGVPALLRLESSATHNIQTDGTDDVQLLVTVLDSQGKEINNSPDVTLRVVSGPGEFPTGSSITFKADSDIPIIEGKAAIAFRSYYAGTSIIEASADGLKSTRLKLQFVGGPIYQEKGPQKIHRPYIPYSSSGNNKQLQTFGFNNPIFASSQQKTHSTALAGDNNPSTWWKPLSEDPHPFCVLDTEKELEIQQIQLVFANEDNYRINVEVSNDQKEWIEVDNLNNTVKRMSEYKISFERPYINGRFIRVTFIRNASTKSANLAEFIVKGYVRN